MRPKEVIELERRERIATAVMVAAVSNPTCIAINVGNAEHFARTSIALADELIAQLDKDADQ